MSRGEDLVACVCVFCVSSNKILRIPIAKTPAQAGSIS